MRGMVLLLVFVVVCGLVAVVVVVAPLAAVVVASLAVVDFCFCPFCVRSVSAPLCVCVGVRLCESMRLCVRVCVCFTLCYTKNAPQSQTRKRQCKVQ